jgi:hypothetical protein
MDLFSLSMSEMPTTTRIIRANFGAYIILSAIIGPLIIFEAILCILKPVKPLFLGLGIFIGVLLIGFHWISSQRITIRNNRFSYHGAFGYRRDLPIEEIQTIKFVSSSEGKIDPLLPPFRIVVYYTKGDRQKSFWINAKLLSLGDIEWLQSMRWKQ